MSNQRDIYAASIHREFPSSTKNGDKKHYVVFSPLELTRIFAKKLPKRKVVANDTVLANSEKDE